MKTTKLSIALLSIITLTSTFFVACQKDTAPAPAAVAPTAVSLSMTEEFTDASTLANKGWVITNNSNPQGPTAWRQGLYENNYNSKTGLTVGMPAYSSETSPFDFISCDATSVNSAGVVNCWLITPTLQVKNGDVLSFFTRSMDDSNWPNFARDRMQVRANYNDGTADCGTSAQDTGKFTRLLVDINPNLGNNFGATSITAGYPSNWFKVTITVAGLSATPRPARFGFRYMSANGGVTGGINGTNASSVVGIDQLNFVSN